MREDLVVGVLALIFVFVAAWLLMSFINMTSDMAEWSAFSRVAYLLLSIGGVKGVFLAMWEEEE